MHRTTFDSLRRRAILKEEEPGRWSNRYLHSGLDDVTIAKKKNGTESTRGLCDGLVLHPPHSFACVMMRASFYRENRLWRTFSNDGIRGSLYLAAANAISALLSSGDRPLITARETLARTKKTLEESQENCGVPLSRDNRRDIFSSTEFSTSVNLGTIVPRFMT